MHINVTQYYMNTVPQVHWGKPDIWLGLVSYGFEAYPMLMGKGSSTRYEEMKQRGPSILKTFIIYCIFSYVQHSRIHHIKCRWSLALTLVLVTLTLPYWIMVSHYKLLPNKYLELNKTKAIAGDSRLGSYSPYSYYTNTHRLYCTIIKLEKL